MVQALSDREFILQRVVQILTESAASNDSNLVLQLALTELVKQVMRELAQASETDQLQGKLLQRAVQTTIQLIEARAAAAAQFDLSPYFERIYRSLRWVAKEMTDLETRLQQARQGEVLRVPRIVSDVPVPFQITELGIRSAPEGLMAHPLSASRLNLEAIQWSYRVRGMDYPWEVVVDELTFVVEADGSIVTFLEGFPDSVIEQAGSALEQLARSLYIPVEA